MVVASSISYGLHLRHVYGGTHVCTWNHAAICFVQLEPSSLAVVLVTLAECIYVGQWDLLMFSDDFISREDVVEAMFV